MKNIYCFSRADFDRVCCINEWKTELDLPDWYRVISISNTSEKYHRFSESIGNVINLDFDDISCESMDDCVGISKSQAHRIIDFIDPEYDYIIYCDAGKSRSQAIVRYILDTKEGWNNRTKYSNPCLTPNYYILSTLKAESVL